MIDLNKYNEKEVIAAILAVQEIVDDEDFSLGIVEDDEELQFSLIDHQGAYLGDIGNDRFSDLGAVINRMEIYHNDYFYHDYEERVDQGEQIPQDDWCRKALIFLESGYCQDLLMDIDVETYQKFNDKYLSNEKGHTYTEFLETLNSGEYDKYVQDDVSFDFVGYLCDKSIAMKIMDTQSAYDVVEHNGLIYELYNDDIPNSVTDFKKALKQGDVSDFDFCVYETFAALIEGQKGLILDDFNDIGLYDNEDNWQFYLSEYELEYVGLGVEKDKFKEENLNVRMFTENDFSDEFVEEHLEELVKNAKLRALENSDHDGNFKASIDKDLE